MQTRRKSFGKVLAVIGLLGLAVSGFVGFKAWPNHDGHDHTWMRKEAILAPLPGAAEVGRDESVGDYSSGVEVRYALPREPEAVLREYVQRFGGQYRLRSGGLLELSGHSKSGLDILIQASPLRFAPPHPIPDPLGTRTVVRVSVSRPL